MTKIKLTRDDRLAQALRDNLRKRKAAQGGEPPKSRVPNDKKRSAPDS